MKVKNIFGKFLKHLKLSLYSCLFLFAFPTLKLFAEPHVLVVPMNSIILPGSQSHLKRAILEAKTSDGKAVVVLLNTPGGILQTTQEMIQDMFQSEVPVIVYVSPEGGTATSAGVFITMAAHVAAMANGTSIGAAHPVSGDGKDIEGDMREKATNMTVAMAKSLSEQRNRNSAWVEKAVKESVSLTATEAVKENVVDFIANDLTEVLLKIKGKEVTLNGKKQVLEDLSKLPQKVIDQSFQEKMVNFMANPTVAAMLWLGATTGLTIELYNPGLIFPGVVGAICLILALMVTQTIPVTTAGVALLCVGSLMLIAELKVASGVLGLGGVLAIVLGSIYLVDVDLAPGLSISLSVILPVAIVLGGLMSAIVFAIRNSYALKVNTGKEGIIGAVATVFSDFNDKKGQVMIEGALWKAISDESSLSKGTEVQVVAVNGLTLQVKRKPL